MKQNKIKTIHLHNGAHIRFTLFPDNQPHIQLLNVTAGDEVQVIADLTSSVKLIHLLQAANAIDHAGAVKKQLVIPYLMCIPRRLFHSSGMRLVFQIKSWCKRIGLKTRC